MKFQPKHLQLGLIFLALSTSCAWAKPHKLTVTSSNDSEFVNSDCKKTQTCSLKSFGIHVEQYRLDVPDPVGDWTFFGTKMVASYETDKNSNLEKFGIGQFIQGCKYISRRENGVVTRYPFTKKEYRGKFIPFIFPKMVIDGFSSDPLSWDNIPKRPRHFAYLNKYPDREIQNSDYHGVNPAQDKKLYVMDHPDVSGYYPDTERALNTSLKFKTCIYRSSDVPKDVAMDHLDFAKPIHCFEWASSYVYNYELGKFESLPEIDPYCLSLETKN